MNSEFDVELIDIAPTIANILKITMPEPTGKINSALSNYAQKNKVKKVIVVIVDSLGYSLYNHLEHNMPTLSCLASKGFFYKCKSPATTTTPSIASILTGYYPSEHQINFTKDIIIERKKTLSSLKTKSILEWGHQSGIASSLIIEAEGAKAMEGLIDNAIGIPDSKDILEFDAMTKKLSIKEILRGTTLIVLHLRSIDRYAHRSNTWIDIIKAGKSIDTNVHDLLKHLDSNTLIFICGDHTIHSAEKWLINATENEKTSHIQNNVALIVCSTDEFLNKG